MKLVRFKNSALPGFFNDNWAQFFNDDFSTTEFRSTKPAVNVRETENGYSLEVAAPGMKKEDFRIDLDRNILTISVSKENEQQEQATGYTRREFHYSSFSRSFTLPETIDTESISGSYTDGILNVQIPKKVEAKPEKKVITVA
jgi:HSP20 family protein